VKCALTGAFQFSGTVAVSVVEELEAFLVSGPGGLAPEATDKPLAVASERRDVRAEELLELR
jgi:hypothetical protein